MFNVEQDYQSATSNGYEAAHNLVNTKLKAKVIDSLSKRDLGNDQIKGWAMRLSEEDNMENIMVELLKKLCDLEGEKKEYKQKAYYCNLTNSLNRNFFEEFAINFDQKRKNKNENNLFLFYLDLNKFKQINDQLGHKIGDEVLVEFSKRLSQVTRAVDIKDSELQQVFDNDFFVRLGGDEFIGKFHIEHEKQALVVKNRIEHVMSAPFETSKGKLTVSVSIGFEKVSNEKTIQDIMEEAEIRMYEQKRR